MLRLALALLLAMAAAAAATHSPGVVDATCAPRPLHDYVAAPPGSDEPPRVMASPLCASPDAHPHFGVGGAFLAADHHDRDVCLADDVALDASFFLAIDGDGDGVLSDDPEGPDAFAGPFEGCATALFDAGADGGWWVVLGPRATAGHILS